MLPQIFRTARAVIFDLDGTLIDSMGSWNDVDRTLLDSLGHSPLSNEVLCEFRERSLLSHAKEKNPYIAFCGDLGSLCNTHLTAEEIHKMRRAISRRLLREEVRLRPGALEIIGHFAGRGADLAIATTTKRANIDLYETENPEIASRLSFTDTFSLILAREDITRIKPDPEIYRLALQKLGRKPEECLVFEDSLAGVKAAREAGISVASIDESWSEKERDLIIAESDYHFPDWESLLLKIA